MKRWVTGRCVLVCGLVLVFGFPVGAAERATDRLHGFSVTLPEGWQVRMGRYGVLLSDFESFVLVRGAPRSAPGQAVAPFLQETRYLSRGGARVYFKGVPGGLLVVAQGLRYPWEFAQSLGRYTLTLSVPQARTYLQGLSYEAAHLLLAGERAVLAVSVYLPQDLDRARRAAVLGVLRSFGFVPSTQRVPYTPQPIYDPVLGLVAAQVPVPEGYAFQAGVAPQGNLRFPAFSLRQGRKLVRRDVVHVWSGGVQTQFGSNAQTRLTWNGSVSAGSGPTCLTSQGQLPQLVLQLWRAETGAGWTLVQAAPWRERSRVARYLQNLQEATRPKLALPGSQTFDLSSRLVMWARSGGLLRRAWVEARSLGYLSRSFAANSFNCEVYLQAVVVQGEQRAFEDALGVSWGVLLGIQWNPEWPVREAERSRAISRMQTEMVLEMTRKSQEFNSWMSRSWTNLLSDQTYVRDPATSEIFRVYKRSFDEGTFWRDPVFGGIVGGVERGSRLEEVLQSGGWRRLEESLSGVPGTWR
ncbi:MAG: hypothetical protein QN193_03410 [Armatimonadota bacterium]|nr:hypothetical protein [Armatimonadota bacterium]MDR7569637.1 hypothetical protein [Armatimonadota bacterium]MDR7614691.1 hypothetical protein [Armatimonadota bacterium]